MIPRRTITNTLLGAGAICCLLMTSPMPAFAQANRMSGGSGTAAQSRQAKMRSLKAGVAGLEGSIAGGTQSTNGAMQGLGNVAPSSMTGSGAASQGIGNVAPSRVNKGRGKRTGHIVRTRRDHGRVTRSRRNNHVHRLDRRWSATQRPPRRDRRGRR